MNLKKIVAWLLVALVVLYAISFPDDAAHFVRSAGDGLDNVASGLASFVGSLG